MKEIEDLATAMLGVMFAAVMLVVGHFYMEGRAQPRTPISVMKMVSIQTSPISPSHAGNLKN